MRLPQDNLFSYGLCLLLGILLVCRAEEPAAGGLSPADKARIEALCRDLGHGDEGKRWDAARALVAEGDKAIEPLGRILRGGWVEGKKMAAWTLGQIRSPAAVPTLCQALADPLSDVRWKATISLVQIGNAAIPELRQQLKADSPLARQCAAWALGDMKDAGSATVLSETMADGDRDVRWKAAISLTQLGPAAVPSLVEALRSESEEARQCAAWAFGRLGPAAIEALPQLARDPNPIVRAKTAVATSLIGGEAAREVAASLARDRHPVVRKEACRSLGRLDADLPDGHRATQVPRNGVFETRLRMDEPEPLAHVGPEILFSAPSDQLHRVRSFVSREHEGCARILATEPGLWYFEAAPQKDQSPRIQGVFECTPEKGFPGEVRVRETLPPGLQFDDGTPFFPVSAGLMGLNGRRRDGRPAHLDADWRAFMRDAGESGIRHARLFLLEAPWVRPEEVAQFPEFSPWVIDRKTLRYDLARFEPAFWDKLDVVLFAALQARIVVEIVVFDEGGLDAGKGNRWELHPFNSALGGPVTSERQGWPAFYDLSLEANRAAQERYVAYLLLRTRAFPNVWYQVNHEMGAGDLGDVGLRWLKHWPTFFEENGPPKRFLSLSVHPRGKDLLSAPRFDLVYPPAGSLERIPGLKRPQMAAAPAGAGDMDERWHAWRALFTGVPAVRGPWTPVSARDGLFFYARGLSALLTMVDAWAFEPLDSVILSLPAGVRGVAGRNGDALWVYLQGSYRGNGTLRLGVADPPLVQAQWFSTETGNAAAQTESPVEDGAVGLRPPDFAKDILLRVGMPRSKSVKFQWKQD